MSKKGTRLCKVCKKRFKALSNNHWCCSPEHAVEYVKQQKKKREKKEWNKKKKKKLPVLYPKKYKNNLQSQINLLARKIDAHFEYNCIDCGVNMTKQVHGAHFHNVKGNENIRFNLHNIHSATSQCNKFNSEHKVGYREGIINRYGKQYLDYINSLGKKYPYLGLNEVEVAEKLALVRKINRGFENHTGKFGSNGKEARDYFNKLIKIYG